MRSIFYDFDEMPLSYPYTSFNNVLGIVVRCSKALQEVEYFSLHNSDAFQFVGTSHKCISLDNRYV